MSAFYSPARLAVPTRQSLNSAEARQRVLKLYREWYRGAPDIVSSYELNIPVSAARYALRQRFEYNRYVTDPKAIDVLITKSQMEFQETMNHWKMRDHVLGILLRPQQRPQKSFMQKFIEGRDEEAITPAASGIV
ncbi:hypothetical protein BD626DRAFT_457523 [Schizophyllum amplum]|uniref:Complex 1 LYR protein domain-containing protein n=1 Tax=Schizophyllum amplum TaxID=97359 RepID=A0A550CEP0_9AGAR|nr:hypothetical protein BD626DRAFT_457523 [Auriculariopsis ampla]